MAETRGSKRQACETPWRPTMAEDDAWFRMRKRWRAEIRKHRQGWWEIRILNRGGREVAFKALDATERGAKGAATSMLRKAQP